MIGRIVEKYKSFISYLFFGVCTTVVNVVSYSLFAYYFDYGTFVSNLLAWILAVAFAFFTNKYFVFESRSWQPELICNELIAFVTCRIVTGVMDMVIMLVGVDILYYNDLIVKCFSNIFVILANYIASKYFVFNKGHKE